MSLDLVFYKDGIGNPCLTFVEDEVSIKLTPGTEHMSDLHSVVAAHPELVFLHPFLVFLSFVGQF